MEEDTRERESEETDETEESKEDERVCSLAGCRNLYNLSSSTNKNGKAVTNALRARPRVKREDVTATATGSTRVYVPRYDDCGED